MTDISAWTSSDVEQTAEFTIEPVGDSTGKSYYKLVLRDEPQDGAQLKVVQKQGRVWYEQGVNSASTGTTLQRAETAQAKFLLERTDAMSLVVTLSNTSRSLEVLPNTLILASHQSAAASTEFSLLI